MNVIIKSIAAIVIVLAAMLALYSYKDVIPFFEGSTTERLQSLWERDIESLKEAKKLPESFQNVKEINLNFGSKTAQKWMTAVEVPVEKKSNGTHRLEVFVDHWSQGKEYGAIIQYQLVNLATNDTEWELGRTLTLGETTDAIERTDTKEASDTANTTETSNATNAQQPEREPEPKPETQQTAAPSKSK